MFIIPMVLNGTPIPEFLRIIGLGDMAANFQSVGPANETLGRTAILVLIKFNKMAHSAGLSEKERMCGMQKIISDTEINSHKQPLISMCGARRLTRRFHHTSNWLQTRFGLYIEPFDANAVNRTRFPRWPTPRRKAGLRVKAWFRLES